MLDRLPIALVAAVAGWWVGWLSAWLTGRLEGNQEHAPEAETAVTRGGLVRDLWVQAGCAVVWAAVPLVVLGDWLRWLEAGLVAVPLIQVAVTDIRTRYVYTVVALVGVAVGLAFGWHVHSPDMPWWTSLAGAAGGWLAFGLLYLLGRLLYRGRVEAMARGDVTIAAMVGAGAAACTPLALFGGVLCGAAIAIGLLLAGRSRQATMPYGPGLCLGGLAALFWC